MNKIKMGTFWHSNEIAHWKSRSINTKTIGILTNVFCPSGPNLVIIAWIGGTLCGQAHIWHTHTHAHTQPHTEATMTWWHIWQAMRCPWWVFGAQWACYKWIKLHLHTNNHARSKSLPMILHWHLHPLVHTIFDVLAHNEEHIGNCVGGTVG